jgi:hypothetical protein
MDHHEHQHDHPHVEGSDTDGEGIVTSSSAQAANLFCDKTDSMIMYMDGTSLCLCVCVYVYVVHVSCEEVKRETVRPRIQPTQSRLFSFVFVYRLAILSLDVIFVICILFTTTVFEFTL